MNLITQYIWTAHFGITVRIRVGFIIHNWIPLTYAICQKIGPA